MLPSNITKMAEHRHQTLLRDAARWQRAGEALNARQALPSPVAESDPVALHAATPEVVERTELSGEHRWDDAALSPG